MTVAAAPYRSTAPRSSYTDPDHLRRPHGVSRYRTDNISNARARGAEVSAAWRPAARFDVRAVAFLDTEIPAVNGLSIAQTPYSVGDPLLRRRVLCPAIDATVTQGRVSAFAQIQARGETLDAEPAFGPSGGLYPTRATPSSTSAARGGP